VSVGVLLGVTSFLLHDDITAVTAIIIKYLLFLRLILSMISSGYFAFSSNIVTLNASAFND